MAGYVHQINVKPKTPGQRGLPKLPVTEARVTSEGVGGDFNVYRSEKLPGDRDQALLLMPIEMIMALNAEGWTVESGHLGENITTQGIPYGEFAPGKTYTVGGEVVVQVSKACPPCRNLYDLPYVGREKGPAFLRTMVDRRGWYARVLREGAIRVGDLIEEIAAPVG